LQSKIFRKISQSVFFFLRPCRYPSSWMTTCLHSPSARRLQIYFNFSRKYSSRSRRSSRGKGVSFPHGLSATEHLVPASQDGSTPLTDKLPRSIILDPTAYAPKVKVIREREPSGRDAVEKLTPLERQVMYNPFGRRPQEKRLANRQLKCSRLLLDKIAFQNVPPYSQKVRFLASKSLSFQS